jgi:hypothetical protein
MGMLGMDIQVSEDQLPNDGAHERDVAKVVLGVGGLPNVTILEGEDGDDGSDDLQNESVTSLLQATGRDGI